MQIQGRAYFEHGLPAVNVPLRFYHRGFAGAATRLGDQVTTGADGAYILTYSQPAATPVNLEARAVSADGGREISLSEIVLCAGEQQLLNLVVPTSVRPLASEYQRLDTDLARHLNGRKLGDARESREQRDVTLLQCSVHWDARLIALAAVANKLSSTTGVEPQALYGMLRAGLPIDPMQLARVSRTGVGHALRKATQAGVVALTAAQIEAAQVAFDTFARTTRRLLVGPGGLSSYGEMLVAAGLSSDEQRQFDEIFAAHDGPADQLWRKTRDAGLPIDRLQLTARLGYLTLNNADLVGTLRTEIGESARLSDVLVGGRLYQPETWSTRIKSMAGHGQVLANLIPPAYAGETTDDRLAAYAADLARKVRLSYPTQIVRHMIVTDQLRLGAGHQTVKGDVATVLERAATVDGFSLGRTPLSVFVRDNAHKLFQGMSTPRATAATQQIKTLHRLYQIAPNDEAMKVLLNNGFTSAYDITAMSSDKFVSRYGGKFASVQQAKVVYQKAQQVTTVIYTFFGAAKLLDSPPPVHVLSPPASTVEEAKSNLIKHYPTMETLFGSLDYCECDHCRSVLSPAAYLVDLLKFLDPDAIEWEGDLTEWAAAHGNAPYPFPDQARWSEYLQEWSATHPGEPPPETLLTPYQVLTERRPDLPEMPLTCENTHTAMPYIDIVNEILEYYLVHGELGSDAGHDTGNAATADLLAEPQHILPPAYDILQQARYPLALPFNLWLETVRRFCEHFDTPLWRVLDVLRTTDELYPPAASVPYGRVAVFLERLGISAEEYAIFTSAGAVASWHELYGYQTGAQALTALTSAKTLARRLNVSYRELVALIRCGFVNPRLETLVTLRKIGIDTEDILRYQEQAGYPPFSTAERTAFETKLADGGLAWVQQAWDRGDFARILVLADPNAGCSFDETTLRYADGTPADAMAFLTINYLVRLWRRLGWSMAETDRALQLFLPGNPDPRTAANLGPAMATALLGMAHLDSLNGLLKGGKTGRLRLLYLWSPIDEAKYVELFLAGNTQSPDLPVLDHPLGQYLRYLDAGSYKPFHFSSGSQDDLSSGKVGLGNHLGAVQAALQLTADDVGVVLADAGTTVSDAPLNLATVSLLHRYGLLARLLKLPATDLIVLKELSGLDPFKPLHDGPVTVLDQDHPYRHTQRFAEVAAAVKESRLSVADLNYLMRHRFDPLGPDRSAARPPLTLLRELAAGIDRIRAEHAVPALDAALSFTDDVIRQKLALVWPPDVVETFLGMWTGTVEYRVAVNAAEADQLDPALFADEPAIAVSYDGVLHLQRLVYRGVLLDGERANLQAKFPQPVFAALLGEVQQQARSFFEGHLQKTEVGAEPAGFLEPGDFSVVFTPSPEDLTESQQRNRRHMLAKAFLPYLQDRLVRQLVVQTVAADLGAEPGLAEALLTSAALLDDPDQAGRPLLEIYAKADQRGVSLATGPDTVRIEGYVEVAVTGPFRFFVVCDQQGSEVEIRFDHLTDPLLRGTAGSDGAELSEYIELRAGLPYGFTIEAKALDGGKVTLLVQGEQLPKGALDRLIVYPRDGVGRIHRTHLLLAKTLRLVLALELSEREVRHLLTHADDFGGLDLGELPTRTADDNPIRATTLFGQFLRLVEYVRLRHDLAAEPDDMVDLFAAARRTFAASADPKAAKAEMLDDLCDRFGKITRRDPATIGAAADLLGMSPQAVLAADRLDVVVAEFAQERGIGRLWDVLTMAAKLGVAPDALGRWATPSPDHEIAHDLRDTVKARYEPDRWRRVAQPIFDKLRQRRRDALVAHIMHTDGFDRIEQLFEHFLIDPGTEPVVQTSRLRLAISSVQLFVQRCLLNLELKVPPSALNSAHWQWMKRYRVWEANRKIFLFPENWLEPEWRDDKTHLFVELESALLQSDLSNDHAETAFFSYLRQLEDLAHLDIRAIYLEERADSTNVLHVVARTFRSPHKYYYRSYAHQMWTPWVPVTADIEGDHLVVVVWRGRVHLFWVTFLAKDAKSDAGAKAKKKMPEVEVGDFGTFESRTRYDAQLSWSEYFQGEWTNPGSSGFRQLPRLNSTLWPPGFDPTAEFLRATVEDDDSVWIRFNGFFNKAFRVVNKNSAPLVKYASTPPAAPPYLFDHDASGKYVGSGKEFSVKYVEKITTKNGQTTYSCQTTKTILRKAAGYTLTVHSDRLHGMPEDIGRLVSPFFYADGQHTLYVEPTLTEETTIQQGDGFAVASKLLMSELNDPGYWEQFEVAAHVPIGPGPVELVAPMAKFAMKTPGDWATSAGTLVPFGDGLIGPTGGVITSPIPEAEI